MKHKYYDMIVAKAANMDLIQFVYSNHFSKWVECAGQEDVRFVDGPIYFLCLPKHKEAVLHGLNGGEFQVKCSGGYSSNWYLDGNDWRSSDIWYMLESHESRIKPRKEKRWIGVFTENGVTTDACMSLEEAQHHPMVRECLLSDWQIIEIEVEV